MTLTPSVRERPTGLPHRLFRAFFLAAGASLLVFAAANAAPSPCLSPPVPMKQGIRDPGFREGPSPGPALAGARATRLLLQGGIPASPEPRHFDVIAIRVDFSDEEMDSSLAYFERLVYFMRQYYDKVSDGLVTFDVTFADSVYRLPLPQAYYGLDDSLAERQAEFSRDAIRVADPDVDFTLYNSVWIFRAGPGQESDVLDDSRESLWSLFFRKEDFGYYLPDSSGVNGLPTEDTFPDGKPKFVEETILYPESESQDGYQFGMLGVLCHEFGHQLGLPDLYDTLVGTAGLGNWELMATGQWNGNGYIPAEFSIWSKVFLGWITPVVLTGDVDEVPLLAVEIRQTDELRPGASAPASGSHGVPGAVPLPQAALIPAGGDEAYLLENRLQDPNRNGKFDFEDVNGDERFDFYNESYLDAEFDFFLPGDGKGSGLLIWHIDQSVIEDNLFYNTVNGDASHKGIDLEEADGIEDLDVIGYTIDNFGNPGDPFRAMWDDSSGLAWNDAFTPTSLPSSDGYHGAYSGVSVTDISVPGNVMTFSLRFAGENPGWPVLRRPAPGDTARVGGNRTALTALGGEERALVVAEEGGRVRVFDAEGGEWDTNPLTNPLPTGAKFRSGPLVVPPPPEALGLPTTLVLAEDGEVYRVQPGAIEKTFELSPFRSAGRPTGAAEPAVFPLGAGGERSLVVGAAPDGTGRTRLLRVPLEEGAVGPSEFDVEYEGAITRPPSGIPISDRGPGGPLRIGLVMFVLETPGGDRLFSESIHGPVPAETPTGIFQGLVYDPADSLLLSAPVVGDLDRDGVYDVIVTASDGTVHALTNPSAIPSGWEEPWKELPGFPVRLEGETLGEVSLADLDDDGYLEILGVTGASTFFAIHYNGTVVRTLPKPIPAEYLYREVHPLPPLVYPTEPGGKLAAILPLPDGQITAVDAMGTRLPGWPRFGARDGKQAPTIGAFTNPLDLVFAEDFENGSRVHSLLFRSDARPDAFRPSPWPAPRHDDMNTGIYPIEELPAVPADAPLVTEFFSEPNPIRGAGAGGGGDVGWMHFRLAPDAERAEVEILTITGSRVRKLSSQTFPGTENRVPWDLRDDDGAPVASGLYLARLEVKGARGTETKIYRVAVIR